MTEIRWLVLKSAGDLVRTMKYETKSFGGCIKSSASVKTDEDRLEGSGGDAEKN